MSSYQIFIQGKPMSNYSSHAINPKTKEVEPAMFLDFGRSGYYVRFEDGSTYPDSQITEVKVGSDYPAVIEQK